MIQQSISQKVVELAQNTVEYVNCLTKNLNQTLERKLNEFTKILESELNRESQCSLINMDQKELSSNLGLLQSQIQEKIEKIQVLEQYINNYEMNGKIDSLDWLSNSPLQFQHDEENLQFQDMQVEQIQTQLVKKTKVNRQTCHYCGLKFDSAIDLSKHLSVVHKSNLKETWGQKQQAKNKQAQMEYTQLELSSLQYTCQLCQKVTKGIFQNYRIHLRLEHDEEEWFKCPICNTMFNQSIILARHLLYNHSRKIHRQRFVYECVYTSKQMANPKELDNHITQITPYHKQAPDQVINTDK